MALLRPGNLERGAFVPAARRSHGRGQRRHQRHAPHEARCTPIRATNASVPTDFVIREFRLSVTPVVDPSNSNLLFANKDSLYTATLTATGGASGFTWSCRE